MKWILDCRPEKLHHRYLSLCSLGELILILPQSLKIFTGVDFFLSIEFSLCCKPAGGGTTSIHFLRTDIWRYNFVIACFENRISIAAYSGRDTDPEPMVDQEREW